MNPTHQTPRGANERQSVNPARLRFTWGASPSEPARWRLGVLCWFRRAKSPSTGNYYVPSNNELKYPLAVVVSVRGLLSWGIALGLALLLGGAGVLFALYSKNPFNQITYADLALPWRWSGLDALRGRSNLARAEQSLKDGDIRAAFTYLRAGLNRYPGDNNARLQLATLFILYRVRAEAEKTLLQAFDHGYPGREYVRKAAELLQSGDNQDLLIEFCDKGLAANAASASPSKAEARFLDGIKASTLLETGRADEALDLVERSYRDELSFLHMTRVMHSLAGNDIAGAEARLTEWLNIAPDSPEALASAVRVYRRAGAPDRMQEAILRLRSLYPDNPTYVSLGLTENLLAGRVGAALDLLDISVIRFADKPEACADWAEAISRTGNREALGRLEQLLRETGRNPQFVIFTHMMTAIRAKAWADAEACDARLQAMTATMSPRLRSMHEVAKALLAACTQPVKATQSTLVNSLTGGWVGLHLYRQIIDALDVADRYDTAMEVITVAEGYFPGSRYLAGQRGAISGKLARQNAAAQSSSLAASSPRETTTDYATESAFYEALDNVSAAGRHDEALRMVRSIRQSSPSWLKDGERRLDWEEIQIAGAADDLAQFQLKIREFARNANETELTACTTLAESWHAQGKNASALVVIREVLRAHPANAKASSLLTSYAPSSEISETSAMSAPLPSSQAELFDAIDNTLKTKGQVSAQMDALTRQIRAVRKATPVWLDQALPELEWREILLAARADDIPLLQLNVRTYLRSRSGAVERCINLAREWHDQGKISFALLILREVLRQNPEHRVASKLLVEWNGN